jgi:hypothetical protein
MPAAYDELVELARMCWRQSRIAQTNGLAPELVRMAQEYRQKAAKLDSGKLPEIAVPEMDNKPIV